MSLPWLWYYTRLCKMLSWEETQGNEQGISLLFLTTACESITTLNKNVNEKGGNAKNCAFPNP